MKLTFQVTEQATDNGVQPHQTFLRFFDSTTGEEGIQPVKIAPSGKAKFELVRCFSTCTTWPSLTQSPPSPQNKNVRIWPSPRALSHLPVRRRCMCLSSSAPSCTVPRHSTSLTYMSRRLLPRRCTQKKSSTNRVPSSRIPSIQSQNSLPAPSLRSSPRSFLPHGPSSSYWYVWYLSRPASIDADDAYFVCAHSGALFAQAFRTSSRLASSLSYSRSLSSKASFSGTGSSFVSDRSSCMARVRPRLPYSRVSKLSQALLNAGPVVDSRFC